MKRLPCPTASLSRLERDVFEQPNSSYRWISYSTEILKASGVDDARDILLRAVNVINPRLEDERLNIYKALLNLEFYFGSEDTFDAKYTESATACDRKIITNHVVELLVNSAQFEKAVEKIKLLLKKSKDKVEPYLQLIRIILKNPERQNEELAEEVKETVKRALQSLPKSRHVEFLSRYARIEFGVERLLEGRTVFENLLSTYPQRADLWSLFLDCEIKYSKDVGDVRALFERAISSIRKNKSQKLFLIKWAAYENKYGDSESQKIVASKIQKLIGTLQKRETSDASFSEDELSVCSSQST